MDAGYVPICLAFSSYSPFLGFSIPPLKYAPNGGSGKTREPTSGILLLFFSLCVVSSSQHAEQLPVRGNIALPF